MEIEMGLLKELDILNCHKKFVNIIQDDWGGEGEMNVAREWTIVLKF